MAFVGVDDCTLGEDVTAYVVGVGWTLDHSLDGYLLGLAGARVVDANLVVDQYPDEDVPACLSINLASGLADQSELLLAADFSPSLAACLNPSSTTGLSS